MSWSDLAQQFSLELAFGVLLALAFVPRAPVGLFFYRLMGTTAVLAVLLGVGLPLWGGAGSWSDPVFLAALPALVTYPVYSGPVRGKGWALGLGVALAACALAVGLAVHATAAELTPLELTLATGSALATGAVAGSVGLAMVLGHWYLTVPNLKVGHLRRLNRVAVGTMAASVLFLGLSCLVFGQDLSKDDPSLFGPMGLFYLGTRVTVGLVFPLGFSAMVAGSLRFENTRSATGILYASTVLVLIGTAVSVSLQDTYGVPL